MQNREKARVWHLLSIYCVSGAHNLIRPQNEKRTSRATWVMQKGRLGLQTPPVQGHTASKQQSQALNPSVQLPELPASSACGRKERERDGMGGEGAKGWRRSSGGDSDLDVVLAEVRGKSLA